LVVTGRAAADQISGTPTVDDAEDETTILGVRLAFKRTPAT
jgi:hypothetical protein